jgi:50S ribosomal protein L16 3-hydroxylase
MIDIRKPSALLGGLSPQRFMRRIWQQDYRLIRQALAGFQGVVTPKDVLRLATRDDLFSRLIIREGKSWHVEQGPFSARALKTLPPKDWTVLVQDLNTVLPEADALMRQFAFIPYARLDDVMVSLAAPGGGVGPHFDSYDVFLLQGRGRRRWRISQQDDLSLRDDVPLKILKRFKPTHDWVLEPGDMLYLPPKFAHDGVAVDECLTFSIGFREPSIDEIRAASMELDDAEFAQTKSYAPRRLTLAASATPATLPSAYLAHFDDVLNRRRWSADEISTIAGVFASTPKAHVVFTRNDDALTRAAFSKLLRTHAIALDSRTLMLVHENQLYINGESHPLPHPLFERLAHSRKLEPPLAFSGDALALLYDWYQAGWINIIKNI